MSKDGAINLTRNTNLTEKMTNIRIYYHIQK